MSLSLLHLYSDWILLALHLPFVFGGWVLAFLFTSYSFCIDGEVAGCTWAYPLNYLLSILVTDGVEELYTLVVVGHNGVGGQDNDTVAAQE